MGEFLPNKPRLPYARGAAGSWGSGEMGNKNIPGWRRGKEIPIPVKRKENSPRYRRESRFIVDHVDLAGSLEGEIFVVQEESVILSWSRSFVLQGHACTLLILPILHQWLREVVHSPIEVPTWRGDNPLSLSGNARRQLQRQVPSHGLAHSCILHPRAHTGEQPPRDFWHSRACFHQSPVAPAFLLWASCFLKQFW